MPTDPYGFGNYFYDSTQQQAPQMDINDPQLAWIAAINGQTPQQYVTSQANYQRTGQMPQTPYQQWQTTSADPSWQTWQAQQTEADAIAQMGRNTDNYNQALGNMFDQYGQVGAGARQRADWLGGANQQLAQRATDSAQWANAQDQQALGTFRTAVNDAGAWDMQNFNNLRTAANAPMQMNASPYVGDAMSNPADVARQMQVYGQLQGAANGSLDVTSRAAQAYAKAGDIANQQQAAAQLRAAGNGALNVNLENVRELDRLRDPDSIGGMQDLLAASRGSKDVHVGQEDPEAYAAAVAAREKLWGLTDPSVTAQEKLMFEIQRQQQEQDEGGLRAALQTDAQRRGSYGVGSEIARSALGAQQTSRNRMLQDMQALAMAQARSMDALQGHGTLSTNMTAQANQIALQNAQNQLGALSQYTDVHANSANVLGQLGAANATNNANRQLAAQEAAYQAYATLRAQGFSEEYARGQAADVVAMSNSDRRLGAMNSSATLATNMRGQSDAMSQFNQSQRQQQQQFSDSYTANRQDAQFNRQVTVADYGNTVGRNRMTDQGNLFNAHTGVTGATHNRNMGTAAFQQGLNNDWLNQNTIADNTQMGTLGAQQGIIGQQFKNNTAQQGLRVQQGRQAVQDATMLRNNQIDDAQRNIVNGVGQGGPMPAGQLVKRPNTTGTYQAANAVNSFFDYT